MEMNSVWKAFDLMLLTLLISFLIAEYKSAQVATQVPPSNVSTGQMSQQCPTNVTKSVSAQVNAMTNLSCFTHSIKDLIMTTWEILLRDKTPCIIAYREDKNETKETNCSGEGITWESRPEWNHTLRIGPVTIDNDGSYKCVFVTTAGNFQTVYHLSVLVPPAVTLSEEGDGTVVCKAIAGKPAAQIFWVPKGDCFTVNETHHNRTVTVKSTCTWKGFNESSATCFISHVTGSRNMSIEHQSHGSWIALKYTYVILSVVSLGILAIVGLVFYKKSSGCRTCKSPKPEATPGLREDEVEPYASYTEKNNPLYDTRTEVMNSTAS
uniref:Cell surface glycoprotein CD200 receptor 1-like isoform X2 n=1 Tax=Phascolarctos cinereus TaxID=38626 RepID=A0A6P5LWG3_PHACI|nr:cell surface glycoprotein CD200 receptor 1-like isoform X2 [Phascolarctos cinereus]